MVEVEDVVDELDEPIEDPDDVEAPVDVEKELVAPELEVVVIAATKQFEKVRKIKQGDRVIVCGRFCQNHIVRATLIFSWQSRRSKSCRV